MFQRLEEEEEEKGFYKILPANLADHLCQSWQIMFKSERLEFRQE